VIVHDGVVFLSLCFVLEGSEVGVTIEFIQHYQFVSERSIAALCLVPAVRGGGEGHATVMSKY
jgi:hypothetical protein